jgi:hypothetical protein
MILYQNPTISTLQSESLQCMLQVSTGAIVPDCSTDPCDAGVGEGSVCCIFPAGCEPGFDDDDIRVRFFIPNRTDTSEPSCVIAASDPDNPGSDYTVGACNLQLVDSACGNGQVWEITCAITQSGIQDDVCLHGIDGGVFVECDGVVSDSCNDVFLNFP